MLLCTGCPKDQTVPPEETPPEEITPTPSQERVLATPGNLSLKQEDGKVTLSWEDLSTREEGYLVVKKAKQQAEFFLPANSTSWTDDAPFLGQTEYIVRSYWHTDRSAAASVIFTNYSKPEVQLSSLEASWHMVAAGVKVVSDGGSSVTCGISRTREGESQAVDIVFGEKVSAGTVAYILSEDLEENVTYDFKPWAENEQGRVYGTGQSAMLGAAPQPVTLEWDSMEVSDAPEGVRFKKVSTDVFGHSVNMWCAIANLSAGTVAVRTTIASSLTQPGTYIRDVLKDQGKVLALTNGGYFASPASSYSYVCDNGVKKASNVSQLTRTRGYNVTRGFWGVDASGCPAIGWQSGDGFYQAPLPVYDGGPVLSSYMDLPPIQGWIPYNAIGGGPVLVKDGKYQFDYLKSASGAYLSNHELFQADIFGAGLRAPRTAIGSDKNGLVVLLVADGRGSGGSTGLTLDELARVMTGLGCTDVLNLDGGGSSMFLIGPEGTLQNSPSDGQQRKVLSFVWLMQLAD